MVKIITTPEFEEILKGAYQNEEIERLEESGGRLILPQQLGRGERLFIKLRDQFNIVVDDAQFSHPLHLDSYVPESHKLFFGFYLSGSFRIVNPGLKAEEDRVEGWGENCICFLEDIRQIEYLPERQRIQRIMFTVELDCLHELNPNWNDAPTPLQRLIEGKQVERFHQTLGTTTLAMQQALQQILNCPYQGAIQQMYLDKAWELLTLQIIQWAKDEKQSSPTSKLRHDDIERIYHAKHILTQSLDNPPSLLDLARRVGLNDNKLKQGFRACFDTTVFGYFRNFQMELAQQMLAESQMSVTEVAHAVGYASVPSFSTAFRKKFGVTPKEYQAGKRD